MDANSIPLGLFDTWGFPNIGWKGLFNFAQLHQELLQSQ